MQAHLAKPLRLKALSAAIAQWSRAGSSAAPSAPPAADAPASEPLAGSVEEETDPRLHRMFDERKSAALDAIDAVLQRGSLAEAERQEIGSLLHQIAGVAAYFGEEALGETCRAREEEFLETKEDARAFEILTDMRERLAPP